MKLKGGKWIYSTSPILTVFLVISPHANHLILCIKPPLFSMLLLYATNHTGVLKKNIKLTSSDILTSILSFYFSLIFHI